MDDVTEREFEEAAAQGARLLAETTVALSASFDSVRHRVVIELQDGRALAIPPRLVEDLYNATESDLAEIVVDGAGLNLHWPRLEVDLFVPDLMSGVFGTKAWLEAKAERSAATTKRRASGASAAARRQFLSSARLCLFTSG